MKIWMHPPVRRQSGFSLIEVTLALAITSVALVALLAMVPQGLNTLTDATNRSIEARIHQQLISEVSLSDWDKRHNYHETILHYDDQGVLLDETLSQSEIEDLRIYTARLLVPSPNDRLPDRLGGGTYTPVDFSESKVSENELQLILVEISTSPVVEDLDDFDDEENWGRIRTYRATLTRLQDIQSIQ